MLDGLRDWAGRRTDDRQLYQAGVLDHVDVVPLPEDYVHITHVDRAWAVAIALVALVMWLVFLVTGK